MRVRRKVPASPKNAKVGRKPRATARFETARLREEKYRLLFEASIDAVLLETVEGRILECNAAACEMYGYTRAELLELTVADLVPPQVVAMLPEVISRELREGGVMLEAWGKRKDGTIFPTEVSTRLVTLGDEQLVVACVRDITAHRRAEDRLREAEARYRTLVEQIPAVVYVDATDESSSALYMSPQCERMLGYTPEEWLADPDMWVKLLHPEDRERALAENARTNKTGEPFALEYRLIARDGRVVWVRDVAVLVRDETGQPQFWHGVMLDITERKRAEEQLRAQKQLLENVVAVARATTEQPTLEATLQNALNVAVTLTGAEHGDLFLLDEAGQVTHSLQAYSGVTTFDRQPEFIAAVMERGLAGWVARHRQPALIDDILKDGRWLVLPGVPVASSALSVPILIGQTLVGIITLFHSQKCHFSVEHLELMQAAADQMALALRNAQIFDEQRRMAERQTTLYGVLSAVSGQHDLESVARVAVETIVQLTGWPHVAIALLTADEKHWMIQAASGALSAPAGLMRPLDAGVIGRAFCTARTQLVADVSADPDYMAGHPAIRSELAVPLQRGGRVLGALNLESDRPAAFGPEEVLLAESLADALVLALENVRLFQATQNERSRLEALIKSTRDGVILIGMDRRILVINAPALQLLRLPGQPEEWINRPLTDALHYMRRYAPNVVKGTLAEMRRIQKGDEPPAEGEYHVPPRTIHWLNLPVMAGETPLGRLLTLRDVTKERAVEQLREDMMHTMVHDLRNPLGTITASLAFLNMEAQDTLKPEQQQAVDIAQRSLQKMLTLVNSILDVNRLESGQMPLQRDKVYLATVVADVLDSQMAQAAASNLRVENDLPPDLPPVWVDAGLIGRVLQNLIGNAIKFTPPGGAIRVSARPAERDGRPVLQVAVSDTGTGIPPEIEARLFQKFVTGGQMGRGSGLGLAFCKLAIEAHGERVWVESAPGHGATFFFTLPVST